MPDNNNQFFDSIALTVQQATTNTHHGYSSKKPNGNPVPKVTKGKRKKRDYNNKQAMSGDQRRQAAEIIRNEKHQLVLVDQKLSACKTEATHGKENILLTGKKLNIDVEFDALPKKEGVAYIAEQYKEVRLANEEKFCRALDCPTPHEMKVQHHELDQCMKQNDQLQTEKRKLEKANNKLNKKFERVQKEQQTLKQNNQQQQQLLDGNQLKNKYRCCTNM